MDITRKDNRYNRIYQQLQALVTKTPDPVARMATIAAVLYHKFDYYFWCGFYRLVEGELIIGPYQGSLACQKLEKGKGVCWAGINTGKTVLVPDVHKFPGHIACDSRSNSEIVIPYLNDKGEIAGVLDVDSKIFSAFDDTDQAWLEKIILLINK
jgi:L-methionine (R)-S-oxide reductase